MAKTKKKPAKNNLTDKKKMPMDKKKMPMKKSAGGC
jgi:hypothetical protein